MITYGNKGWGNEPPRPGELNQRVTIIKKTNVINENGYPEETQQKVCTVWAKVEQSGDANGKQANATGIVQALNFAIRFRKDVLAGMWVKFDGALWQITALGHYDFKGNYLGLKTIMTQGVSG